MFRVSTVSAAMNWWVASIISVQRSMQVEYEDIDEPVLIDSCVFLRVERWSFNMIVIGWVSFQERNRP